MCSSTIASAKQFLVGDDFKRIELHRLEDHFVRIRIITSREITLCVGHLLAGIDQRRRLQELTAIICVGLLVYGIVLCGYLHRFGRFAAHFHRTVGRFGDGHIVGCIVEHILPPVIVQIVRLAVAQSGFIEFVIWFERRIDAVVVLAETVA